MFPYNYNIPYYNPYNINFINPGLTRGISNIPKTRGLLSRLFGSNIGASSAAKTLNWQGLLNGASRTLGVVNQAIPIVKQAGPMYNNMKQMLKVASLFKDETDSKPNNKKNNTKINNTSNNVKNNKIKTNVQEEKTITPEYSNSPNFFI